MTASPPGSRDRAAPRAGAPLVRIDDLYAAFVEMLPAELVEPARALAVTLGLAPSSDIPWSEVFANEVTLGAPLLVAEAMPDVPGPIVRDAALAHALAVIEAFGTDRVEDGQTPPTPALEAVLRAARRVRNAALARVAPGGGVAVSYTPAEREMLAAIHTEQAILRSGEPVAFDSYLAIAHGKQRVGLPASLALARVAGWDARRVRSLARLLDAISVALQIHDDVIDWEDDLARGGAWAASIAACATSRGPAADRRTRPISTKRLVLDSGVLARMLSASTRLFRAARRRATALGIDRLASWAREREAYLGDLARHELDHPGYANRAHALAPWARTVLD